MTVLRTFHEEKFQLADLKMQTPSTLQVPVELGKTAAVSTVEVLSVRAYSLSPSRSMMSAGGNCENKKTLLLKGTEAFVAFFAMNDSATRSNPRVESPFSDDSTIPVSAAVRASELLTSHREGPRKWMKIRNLELLTAMSSHKWHDHLRPVKCKSTVSPDFK